MGHTPMSLADTLNHHICEASLFVDACNVDGMGSKEEPCRPL
jgi:hypothetical protein